MDGDGSSGNLSLRAPRYYNSAFTWIVLLTTFSFVMVMVLAVVLREPLEAHQQQAFQLVDFVAKAGIGTIFGLLGGKIT
jgi:hypothetical protein